MKAALLLVDLQRDHLDTLRPHGSADGLVRRAAALLEGCRERHLPAIHVWTTHRPGEDRRLPHWKEAKRWLCVAGTAGHEPPEALQPQAGEIIVHKTGFNAFRDGTLEAALRRLKCDAVILAGIHLHTCVRSAAAESLERGLKVFIADDATGSNDPLHAAAVHRWLADRCVQFEPVSALLARLNGQAHRPLVHRSPRETNKVLFEVPIAGSGEVAAAAAATHEAWLKWRRSPPTTRWQLLDKVAKQLDAAAPNLARQMALQIGKPLSHGLEEVHRAAANVRDVIRRAKAFEIQTRGAAGTVRHQPLGVVALISPWNNPVAIPLGKIAPALAYGNTVAWKPAPAATNISRALLQVLRRAGTPAGAVLLVTGDHRTAQKLAADPCVRAVTITSSAPAGFAIQEICARRFVPLQAELSGNNAAIVWDGADWPDAARQIAWAAFGFAGQRCTANRRVIVPKRRFEKFWRELNSAAEKLVWADPLEATTDIGPVIHTGKRDEHMALVQAAEHSGTAHRVEWLLKGHARLPWVKAGAYAQPVMAGCDQAEQSLIQEETMSPLLVVQRADDFDHALALCNGVRHGLAAALFSHSSKLQQKFLAEAEAGILKLNSATAGVDVTLPFGGWKASGVGPPEHGEADRLFYTRMQAVYGGANGG
ncbi:MAG: aldehyde dehydrogenase family protein [Verrucomicrobiota bacterium]|jgi:acyl-CoA reductase-like NAD-dependent aldehyde dehydrogenase/nicotinamidase-related amidase